MEKIEHFEYLEMMNYYPTERHEKADITGLNTGMIGWKPNDNCANSCIGGMAGSVWGQGGSVITIE